MPAPVDAITADKIMTRQLIKVGVSWVYNQKMKEM